MPKKGVPLSDEQKAKMQAGREARKIKMQAAPKSTMSDTDILSRPEVVAQIKQLVAEALKNQTVRETPDGFTIDDIVAAVRKVDAKPDEDGLMDSTYIPQGDLLDQPVVYFVPAYNWALWHKQVGNQLVKPPFGWKKIRFEKLRGWVEKTPNGARQKCISKFDCYSKTISDWIESCPEFGYIIFKDVDQVVNADRSTMGIVEAYARNFGMLDLPYGDLVRKAAEFGVPTSMKYSQVEYRREIANAMTQQQLKSDRERVQGVIQRQRSEDLLAHAQPN